MALTQKPVFIADENSFKTTWKMEENMDKLPKVAVVCPTYNRRKFIPLFFLNIMSQTWPKSKNCLEICILDDGPDCVEDIVREEVEKYGLEEIVKYKYLKEKLVLGGKRNAVNRMISKDVEYIVAFDDDDYYHPERVQHAIERLITDKGHIAGTTVIHALFIINRKMYQSGPFHKDHGTNGTFAYTRRYLKNHQYAPNKNVGEELEFTRHYRERMTQLDPQKTMVCLAHNANTFEKTRAILKSTNLKLSDFLDPSRDYESEKLAFIQAMMDDPEQKILRYQFARRGDKLFRIVYDEEGKIQYKPAGHFETENK